ncbi:MAG: DUF262 domain-containing protein, partial [Bradymonadaceae bacterium]
MSTPTTTSPSATQLFALRTLSVESLLEAFDSSEAWTLHVAQRAFEWPQLRITNLVDSILRGFPIGTLLLAESDDHHYELEATGKTRRAKASTGRKPQILDGQQRCLAIGATFGGDGFVDKRSGLREYLWINVAEPNALAREFDTKRGQTFHFHWSHRDGGINNLSRNERKAEAMPSYLPPAGWLPFHTLVSNRHGTWKMIARHAMVDDPSAEQTAHIQLLLETLCAAMASPSIPVHHLSPKFASAHDLHQVFIRINTGGMPLGAVDEFFAGAKQYWPEAEEHLAPLRQKRHCLQPLYNRRDAITVLARCAAKTLEAPFDPQRLGLQDLARRGDELIPAMQALAPPRGTSTLIDAIDWLDRLAHRRLFATANRISSPATMAALAWTWQMAENHGLPRINSPEYTDPIIQFLFWTSVLGSQRYGRGRFARNTFSRALDAGRRGVPLPYHEPSFQKLCYGYQHIIAKLPTDDARTYQLMRTRRPHFLGIYQRIDHAPVEWDHIIARAYARRRFKH